MLEKELIIEVLKRVNNEDCMNNDELQDIKFMMLNDLVRYHLDSILKENNLTVTNINFENIVTELTSYERDFTKDLLLSI